MTKKYLLGNDAIAYGLIEGGVEGVFGYPGTPSSEITQKLIELSKEYRFYAEWSVNEKVAYENAYGASLTGKRTVVIMKHVGLNVASDAFMTSAYTGVEGGFVIIVADDPFAHSSQNEQDSRRYAIFGKVPYFEPSSIQEAKDISTFAFSFSEKIGLPVIIRSVTRISHGKSDVILGNINKNYSKTSFKKNPEKFVMVPANARTALKKLNEKQEYIKTEIEKLPFNSEEKGDATGIIVSGISYQYVKEIKEKHNLSFSLLKISSYPIPDKQITSFIKDKKEVIVFEEGEPVIEENIYIIAKKYGSNILIKGKLEGTLPIEGEYSLELVEKTLVGQNIHTSNLTSKSQPLPVRAPVLCPGCPHIGSFHILKKVFGKDSIFPGDIGCYTLGVQLGTIDTCLCMGAGISMGTGISRFEKDRPVISIIGDSTFFHSGLTGLINACYNKADQIVAILDNRTTAMTGHQPHPGTGETAIGEPTININLEQLILAMGIEKVITVDPYFIKESIEKLKNFKDYKGVRVIIFKRNCIFVGKQPKKQFFVDKNKCTGCKLCLQLKCPAIIFKDGKAEITNQCSGCGICVEICPFNSIEEIKDGN
ncbi:indolepyruvate ferredoxin oxidoreductase subunit alpha [bacterium]|nr:indolepyruvate ferredoxin oxidoreductase subunit alpha [bacterium]